MTECGGMSSADIAVEGLTVGSHIVNDEELEGAIFDCDGTLIDSMLSWLPSWTATCSMYGLSITEGDFWGFAGLPLPDIVSKLYFAKHGETPSDTFIQQFLASKMECHKAHEQIFGVPRTIECVVSLARSYKSKGIKIAIASSGLRGSVERLSTLFDGC
jgi:beta-phosphoglucomutase-like phosphatase (HAD superfamily)